MREPEALKRRPHWGKYPIPWITHIRDGKPDFRVHDTDKRMRVATERRCQLCGERMNDEVTFIGTERSATTGNFAEPPAHSECMDYALEVCPWLRGEDPSTRELIADQVAPRAQDTETLYVCRSTEYQPVHDGHAVVYDATDARPAARVNRGEGRKVFP